MWILSCAFGILITDCSPNPPPPLPDRQATLTTLPTTHRLFCLAGLYTGHPPMANADVSALEMHSASHRYRQFDICFYV